MTLANKDMDELVEAFVEHNRFYCMEGNQGVSRFTQLVAAIGYNHQSGDYGHPILNFLADNSGAIEKLMEWIGDQNSSEWRESMANTLLEDGFDDVPDEDEEDEEVPDEPNLNQLANKINDSDINDLITKRYEIINSYKE